MSPVGEATSAVAAGDFSAALAHLRTASADRAVAEDRALFVEAMTALRAVISHFSTEEAAARAAAVVEQPDDIQALYDLGYAAVEDGIAEIGVLPLWRANRVAPGLRGVVVELCAALEEAGQNAAAVQVLREANLDDFLCGYLLGFNLIGMGDLDAAKRLVPALRPSNDGEVTMRRRLAHMLERAAACNTPLDDNDLRGWHFVINGSVLLDLSPYGAESMRGRYALYQDSYGHLKEGLHRLGEVLDLWDVMPPRIAHLPDRGSAALGMAARDLFGLPLSKFTADTGAALVVGYDLADVTDWDLIRALQDRHAGQVLFIHTACWTEPPSVAADFSTLLHQVNLPPWGEQLRASWDGEVSYSDPDDRPGGALAAEILSAPTEEELIQDRQALADFALSVPAKLALRPGPRQRFWGSSPVKSTRFI